MSALMQLSTGYVLRTSKRTIMPYPGWKCTSTPLLDRAHSSIEKLVKAVNKRGITTSEEFRPHLLSNDTPQDSYVIITIFSFLLGSILGYLVFQRLYCLRALLYPFGLDEQSCHLLGFATYMRCTNFPTMVSWFMRLPRFTKLIARESDRSPRLGFTLRRLSSLLIQLSHTYVYLAIHPFRDLMIGQDSISLCCCHSLYQ